MKFIFLLLIFSLTAYSQNKKEINLQFKETNQSEFIQSFLSNDNLYILNFENELISKDSMYYVFYNIDLNLKKIKKIKINNGNFLKNAIIKEDDNSIMIINISTFETNAVSYRISKNFIEQEKIVLPIVDHIKKYSLENFLDFKEGIVYQNLKPTKFKGMAFYFKNNAFYSFDNSYSQKSIIFSRKSLEINFEKKYSYNNFNGYENDFREYSKFRNLNTFYSSDDKIFILPELERQPINIEESSILIFDIWNGNLKNIKNFSNIAQINDCEKIRTFDDKQFQMVYENGKKLIEFGIDKMENFCICNSKEINKNFYTIRKLKYKQNKIYIGKNTQSKITQIIY